MTTLVNPAMTTISQAHHETIFVPNREPHSSSLAPDGLSLRIHVRYFSDMGQSPLLVTLPENCQGVIRLCYRTIDRNDLEKQGRSSPPLRLSQRTRGDLAGENLSGRVAQQTQQ
jgi:hypothetical protein